MNELNYKLEELNAFQGSKKMLGKDIKFSYCVNTNFKIFAPICSAFVLIASESL